MADTTVGHEGRAATGRAGSLLRSKLHCDAFPTHGACRALIDLLSIDGEDLQAAAKTKQRLADILPALPLRGPSRSKRTATNVTASKNRRAYSFEQAVPIYRRG
jgi:hypothetical protein